MILYFIVLIRTSLEVSNNLQNKLINLWPEYNSIALDKIIMNV